MALGCSALPYNSNYGAGYNGASYGSSYGAQSVLAPQRVALVGNNYGSSYGSSGLSLGAGYGSGYTQGAGYGSGYAQGAGYGQGLAFNSGLVRSGQVHGSSGSSFGAASSLGANNNFGLLTVHQSQPIEPVVTAAIQQLGRTVEYRAVQNVEQPIQAQVIEVEPSDNPVHLHFKTRSSTLSLSQSHTPAAPQEVQTATAQDEPARLITEVQKPVIQEVRESIIPYRQVSQEILPVSESLHTIVTKGEGSWGPQISQYTQF